MEAEAANRRGYYIVGGSDQFDVQTSTVSLENSIHLFVPEESNKSKSEESKDKTITRKYSLSEIGDLQSKLMLIGGKQGKEREMGQKEKDYFLRVCNGVQILRFSVLSELMNSDPSNVCFIFNTITASFDCFFYTFSLKSYNTCYLITLLTKYYTLLLI